MKYSAILLFAPLLSACVPEGEVATPALGGANPASVYCLEQGGKLVIRRDPKGSETGYCQLPDGRVVEEWELFRAAAGK